jgi:hypothetical protein
MLIFHLECFPLSDYQMPSKQNHGCIFSLVFHSEHYICLLQESIRRCVCIVYDPSRSSQGVLALKALKLTDSFMDLYRNNGLTGEKYELFVSTDRHCTIVYRSCVLYKCPFTVAG